jgi:hypothetical protein
MCKFLDKHSLCLLKCSIIIPELIIVRVCFLLCTVCKTLFFVHIGFNEDDAVCQETDWSASASLESNFKSHVSHGGGFSNM